MEAFKISVIGMITVLLAVKMKGTHQEYSILISIVGCVIVMILLIGQLELVITYIKTMYQGLSFDSLYLKILLKMIGIAYLCEFTSSLCKDAGYSSIANQIEMGGKISILIMSMPIMNTLLDTLKDFLVLR